MITEDRILKAIDTIAEEIPQLKNSAMKGDVNCLADSVLLLSKALNNVFEYRRGMPQSTQTLDVKPGGNLRWDGRSLSIMPGGSNHA